MKFNTRALALLAGSATLTVIANAQAYETYLAYGDSTLVTLAQSVQFGGGPRDAAAAIGSAIPTNVALRIPKIADAQSFKVQVRVRQVGSSAYTFNSGATFIGIDRDTIGGTNYASAAAFYAAADDKKLGFGAGADAYAIDPGSLGSVTNNAGGGDLAIATQSVPAHSGVFGSGTSLRSIGGWFAWQLGTGNTGKLDVGTSFKLYDVVLRNTGLANFDVYGDSATENGISLNVVASSSSRANRVGTGQAAAPGNKYSVEAVPEPGSIVAIAAGLIALAGRRRK